MGTLVAANLGGVDHSPQSPLTVDHLSHTPTRHLPEPQFFQHCCSLLDAHLLHLHDILELLLKSQSLEVRLKASGGNDHLFLVGFRDVLFEAVQDQVQETLVETRSERHVVHQSQHVVQHDATGVALLCVLEDVDDLSDGLVLGHPDEPVSTDHLGEGEPSLQGTVGRHDCLTHSLLAPDDEVVLPRP